MNISEHRIPQDGGARISVGGHKLELRMSIIPTIHGESLVVRLLNADQRLFSLEQLGLEVKEIDRFMNLIDLMKRNML